MASWKIDPPKNRVSCNSSLWRTRLQGVSVVKIAAEFQPDSPKKNRWPKIRRKKLRLAQNPPKKYASRPNIRKKLGWGSNTMPYSVIRYHSTEVAVLNSWRPRDVVRWQRAVRVQADARFCCDMVFWNRHQLAWFSTVKWTIWTINPGGKSSAEKSGGESEWFSCCQLQLLRYTAHRPW